MTLLAKIKACQTMRELDELRYEVVGAMQKDAGAFATLQTAFIHKKNSLQRHGHTRSSEGYTLGEIMQVHHQQEAE